MNKILRMAFVAAVALVSANTFAQNADVTFQSSLSRILTTRMVSSLTLS